jgi:hypothetical protein
MDTAQPSTQLPKDTSEIISIPQVAQEKPKEVLELEQALRDVNSYSMAVGAGTYPGAQVKAINGLMGFLKETFAQLEQKYINHPHIQELMAQSKKANG